MLVPPMVTTEPTGKPVKPPADALYVSVVVELGSE